MAKPKKPKMTAQVRARCGDHCHSTTFDGWYGENVRLFNKGTDGKYACVVCGRELSSGLELGK